MLIFLNVQIIYTFQRLLKVYNWLNLDRYVIYTE